MLLVFIAVQYAKQAAYLECRLSNYFSPACDCEQLLAGTDRSPVDPSLPVLHKHLHVDELYLTVRSVVTTENNPIKNNQFETLLQTELPKGFCSLVGHPPEMS